MRMLLVGFRCPVDLILLQRASIPESSCVLDKQRLKKASIKRVKSVGAVWWKRNEDDAMFLREVDDFKSLVTLVTIHQEDMWTVFRAPCH